LGPSGFFPNPAGFIGTGAITAGATGSGAGTTHSLTFEWGAKVPW
jgi:hypothetical protein